MEGQSMLILTTGVFNFTFFAWKVISLALKNKNAFLGILFISLQAFAAFQSLFGFSFLIAEDFVMFTGSEYEHLNFIWKAFFLGRVSL